MIGDVVGYVSTSDTTTVVSAAPNSDFQNKVLRVMEFGVDESPLVINNQSTALAIIENKDVVSKFKCSEFMGIVCPPELDILGKMSYVTRVMSRKGGYAPILKDMVIAASIHKGKFDDSILWLNQEH